MVRVLHMINSLIYGGSQAFVMNVYRNIDKSKIQFDFVVCDNQETEYYNEIRQLGGIIHKMPAFNGKNTVSIIKAWDELFTENPEYHILHSHVRSYASLYIPIAKKHGVKTIVHSHSISNGKSIKSIAKSVLQFPLRYQADYMFACSREAGMWLFGRKAVSGKNYFTIKNGIDLQKYRYNDEIRKEYRKRLKVDSKTVFIQVGRLTEAKNHIFSLSIIRELKKINEGIELIIVGEGEERDNIERIIDEYAIRKYVRLLGARNDIAELLQAADCMLFPSLWEGFGMVAIEAQSAGVVTLCSDKVPDSVVITDRCKRLPLDVEGWINTVRHLRYNDNTEARLNCLDDVRLSGFDIKESAIWLEEFYLEMQKAK